MESLPVRPPGIPRPARLEANYPNPFNPATTIPFVVFRPGPVSLVVVAVDGRSVAALVNGRYAQGRHRASWDARDLPNGVYVACLASGGFVETRKLVLIR